MVTVFAGELLIPALTTNDQRNLETIMISRRTVIAAGAWALSGLSAAAGSSVAQKFRGKWSGYWDNKWPMSLDVTAVNGKFAQVEYTWPDGSSMVNGEIVGNRLVIASPDIVLTLSGPNSGVAVGRFPTATRTANVSR